MENTEEKKTGKGKFSNLVGKAADFGKKAVGGVQNSVKKMSEKAQNDGYQRRLKKYNPLFPKEYKSKSFNRPNMIVIKDDAIRRGIDVCEGAIGWREKHGDMEVLCLYDEWIIQSGINFVPAASCDSIYYVDNYDKNRYIRVDCIFTKAHEEKLAELEYIAYSLGAKSCSVEIVESDLVIESVRKTRGGGAKGAYGNISAEASLQGEKSKSSKNSRQRSGKITSVFEGNNAPKRPTLKWFACDENIKGLIEMRCSGDNSIKSKILELEGSTSATMSEKTARAIDVSVLKIGGKCGRSMEKQAEKESSSKLVYEIEF